jgi:hypothetical protein
MTNVIRLVAFLMFFFGLRTFVTTHYFSGVHHPFFRFYELPPFERTLGLLLLFGGIAIGWLVRKSDKL